VRLRNPACFKERASVLECAGPPALRNVTRFSSRNHPRQNKRGRGLPQSKTLRAVMRGARNSRLDLGRRRREDATHGSQEEKHPKRADAERTSENPGGRSPKSGLKRRGSPRRPDWTLVAWPDRTAGFDRSTGPASGTQCFPQPTNSIAGGHRPTDPTREYRSFRQPTHDLAGGPQSTVPASEPRSIPQPPHALPESLGQLSQLAELHASNNQLFALPESIGQLKQLQILWLNDNQLSSLPESLRNLRQLHKLPLRGNTALQLPPELLEEGHSGYIEYGMYGNEIKWGDDVPPASPAAILDFYFSMCGGRRPLNEAKMILVGRGGVGKTCLVNRLVHGTYNAEEKKTTASPSRLGRCASARTTCG